jgi:T5SS/PEP-CTERM-associated repeat protein
MVCDGATAIFAPHAVLNDGNALIVGNDAVGTLLARGSGTARPVLNAATLKLGLQDGGNGTATINDAVLNVSGQSGIGVDGTGTLNVTDDGVASFGNNLNVAPCAGATGDLNIGGGGSVTVAGHLLLGDLATPADTAATVGVANGGSLTVDGAIYAGDGSHVGLAGGRITAGVTTDAIDVQAGGAVAGFGSIAVGDGQPIWDAGLIDATGGALTIHDDINGSGKLEIGANSTAVIDASTIKLADIAFVGPDATLALAHGSTVTSALTGFSFGDAIRMVNIDAVSFNPTTGMLALSEHDVTVEKLHMAGSFAGDMFTVQQAPAGALITLQHG